MDELSLLSVDKWTEISIQLVGSDSHRTAAPGIIIIIIIIQIFIISGENDSYDGIETKIFKEISHRLNFTYILHQPPDDNRYGWMKDSNTYSGGLIGSLKEGTADVSFCSLWMVEKQVEAMEVTTPWNQMCITFLVPQPQLAKRLDAVFLPFQPSLWILLSVSEILSAVVLYALAHGHAYILNTKPNSKFQHKLP